VIFVDVPSSHCVERHVGSAAEDKVLVQAAEDADVADRAAGTRYRRVDRLCQEREVPARIVGCEPQTPALAYPPPKCLLRRVVVPLQSWTWLELFLTGPDHAHSAAWLRIAYRASKSAYRASNLIASRLLSRGACPTVARRLCLSTRANTITHRHQGRARKSRI
jgi:hypothetical protein